MAPQPWPERRASLAVLIPALVAFGLMLRLPRVEHPMAGPMPITQDMAALDLNARVTPPVAAPTAVVARDPSPATVLAAPTPFRRPPEALAASVSWATHDLAAVAPALQRDGAAWQSPFHRAPEALAASVPMATHDLAVTVAGLADDIAALRPPFERFPEALAPSVPLAFHDLPIVVAGLTGEIKARAAAQQPAFSRPAEGLIALPPLVTDVVGVVGVGVGVAHEPQILPNSEADAGRSCPATPGLFDGRGGQRGLASAPAAPDAALVDDPRRFGLALARAAKAQAQDLVVYNARYMTIAYPRGDVPAQFGVCTDVVIRAYRALGIDLQELVHLSRAGPADRNIDHRRTELLRKFLATYGEALTTSPYMEDYQPGDIVTYYRPQNKSSTSHIAVVTDVLAPTGRPMIAHNRGWGVQLEDALFVDQMTGHYRFRGLSAPAVAALPRSVMMAAATAKQHPAQRLAAGGAESGAASPVSTERGSLARTPVLSAAGLPDGAAIRKAMKPPMGLGVSSQSSAATPRCGAASATASACRPGRAL